MPSRLELRSPRFADEWVPNYKTALSNLEDDDDDDDDDTTTMPMSITKLEMTTYKLGMEFVTIPGQNARPFTTIGPVAGVILFVLVITLTAVTVWQRRRRQRQIIAHNLDKAPLTATTAEDYSPYNIDADSMPADVYATLDHPNFQQFHNVRFIKATRPTDAAARSEQVRSLCNDDEPRQPQLYAVSSRRGKGQQRPKSCLMIGMGDYDEPEFLIPLNGSAKGPRHQSTVMVNEGAWEHTLNSVVTSAGGRVPPQADEIYYSSLKELESTTPSVDREAATAGDESIPDPDGVYYSSINLEEKATTASSTLVSSNGGSLLLVTGSQDARDSNKRASCEMQRPHYFARDGEDSNNDGGRNMLTKGSKFECVQIDDDDGESVKYDYLQLTDSDKGSAEAPSTSGIAHDNNTQSIKLAESHSHSASRPSTAMTPSCAHTVPGQQSAGNEGDGTECVGADPIYNTLQRGKLHDTTLQSINSNDIYNVLTLD